MFLSHCHQVDSDNHHPPTHHPRYKTLRVALQLTYVPKPAHRTSRRRTHNLARTQPLRFSLAASALYRITYARRRHTPYDHGPVPSALYWDIWLPRTLPCNAERGPCITRCIKLCSSRGEIEATRPLTALLTNGEYHEAWRPDHAEGEEESRGRGTCAT